MPNRSSVDLVSQILKGSINGADASSIMFSLVISFSQVQEYLRLLTSRGLLEQSEETLSYKTTKEGVKFLRLYDRINEIFLSENVGLTCSVN
jgi:predicted transcriptional regulator